MTSAFAAGHLLVVDPAKATGPMYGSALADALADRVTVVSAVADMAPILEDGAIDVAVVDLEFPAERATAIDALAVLRARQPGAALVVRDSGSEWTRDVLHDAWELFAIDAVLTSSMTLDEQIDVLAKVRSGLKVLPDPSMTWLDPAAAHVRGGIDFGELVNHRGHAKMWRALRDIDGDVTFAAVAQATGLTVNTIKNYRSHLLLALDRHGLDRASLWDMHRFARRCRAFFDPYLDDGDS